MSDRIATRCAICVVTYRRPRGLARLLEATGRLTFTTVPTPDLRVVVVDNDPEASASAVCQRMARALPWPLEYHVERERGIPAARNRAVAEAGEVDVVAFIDDDEEPSPGWLDVLLDVCESYGADVVAGPVIPGFPDDVPSWVTKGAFFDRPRYETGDAVRYVGTGNLLIRRRALDRLGSPPFDPQFALTGGSDTHLALRLDRQGASMVWADDAEVVEWQPASRTQRKWVLRRAFRIGIGLAMVEVDLHPSLRTRTLRLAKGVANIVVGAATLLLALPIGEVPRLKALQRCCRGAGMVAGIAGLRYSEYRTTHGS